MGALFGGLPLIATVIIWLGIGGAILGAKALYDHGQRKIGVAQAEKELQPKIVKAEKDRDDAARGRDTAVAANVGLQKDLVALDEQRQACSKQVGRLAKQDAAMKAAQVARKPVDDKRLADIDVDKGELVAALGLPDKGGTCEEQLARSRALWQRIRDQRLRDFPPGTAVPAKDDIVIKGKK